MRNTIAVMNTKGGVGKSTIVLSLAETLAAHHGKNVLVLDSDAQASVSSMLMPTTTLRKLQGDGLTMVDYLVATVLRETPAEWTDYVVGGVSDVDDVNSVYLMPSDMQLTLFEREVSKGDLHARLRSTIGGLLSRARIVFDVVLIDCPPGLSVLTESWLREADYHLSPTKADYISVCGLDVFRRFQALNPEMGFAENLGVVVNMMERQSPEDQEYYRWLAANPQNRCFEQVIPRLAAVQKAARYSDEERSFQAKYPGEIGVAVRRLADEVLSRIETNAADLQRGSDGARARDAAAAGRSDPRAPTTSPPAPPHPQASPAAPPTGGTRQR
ncbi:MAG: ParA family protein [Hyphomicrobiaceae bacterium]